MLVHYDSVAFLFKLIFNMLSVGIQHSLSVLIREMFMLVCGLLLLNSVLRHIKHR